MQQPLQNGLLSHQQLVHAHCVSNSSTTRLFYILFSWHSMKIKPLDDNAGRIAAIAIAAEGARAEGTAIRAMVDELSD
jgi:hypothetical protein